MAGRWDAQQPKADRTVGGRSETDGPTEVTDLHLTETDRKLVTRFVEDVPLGGVGNVTDCISTTQYHPIPPPAQPFHHRRPRRAGRRPGRLRRAGQGGGM
ncbi:hypothetical protein AB0E04_48140, partial [Streptomyces sp. NPDC048251]